MLYWVLSRWICWWKATEQFAVWALFSPLCLNTHTGILWKPILFLTVPLVQLLWLEEWGFIWEHKDGLSSDQKCCCWIQVPVIFMNKGKNQWVQKSEMPSETAWNQDKTKSSTHHEIESSLIQFWKKNKSMHPCLVADPLWTILLLWFFPWDVTAITVSFFI